MLAKVPTKRLDGKSSFVALTQYIASQAAALTHSEQIWDIEAVAQEMEHIASLNERVKDAVYHYVLSWPSGEDPTDQQAFDSVTATLTALNMRDHQWVAALHRNTGHVHTHVEVNRINPETLKSIYPKGDWLVLDQTCRKLELKYGWSHDRGPHSVEMGRNNTPRIARNQPDLNDDAKAARTTGARDFSSWNGRESFQEWVGKEPAQQLKRVVEKPGAKWQHVHDVLGTFNLEYRTKGSGAVVVDRDSPEKLHAKASHVGRFATLQRLEEHLGVFDSPQREPVRDRTNEQASTLEPKAKSYGNETERSASSAGQRQVCRETLYERYAATKARWESTQGRKYQAALQQQRAGEKTRFESLRKENRTARERIKASNTHKNKKVLYSVQAFLAATRREELRLDMKQERSDLRAQYNRDKPGPWQAWLAQQALAGDKAAIAVLRRRRYSQELERKVDGPHIEVGTIVGIDTPRTAILAALHWTTDRQGVNYIFNNVTVFRDEGRRVMFSDLGDEAVRAGLMLCREKWAGELEISGSECFKTKAAALARELGIRVVGQGLQAAHSPTEPARSQPKVESKQPALRLIEADIERLSSMYGKRLLSEEPSLGRQHTGKVVAAGQTTNGDGAVVIDIGRELAVMHTSSEAAVGLQRKLGVQIKALAATHEQSGEKLCWLFSSLERAVGLERDL